MPLITLIATLQPFKPSVYRYNVINIVFLQLLTLFSVTIIGISVSVLISPVMLYFFYIPSAILSLVPFLYFIATSVFWIYTHKRCSMDIFHRLRALRYGYNSLPEEQKVCGILPDRIENPSKYHSNNLTNFSTKQA